MQNLLFSETHLNSEEKGINWLNLDIMLAKLIIFPLILYNICNINVSQVLIYHAPFDSEAKITS